MLDTVHLVFAIGVKDGFDGKIEVVGCFERNGDARRVALEHNLVNRDKEVLIADWLSMYGWNAVRRYDETFVNEAHAFTKTLSNDNCNELRSAMLRELHRIQES